MNINLPIKNFPKQQEIFDCEARYKIVAKGRRFGLTKGAANDLIKKALEGKYKKGLWVDTVNANIERYVERYFIPHLKKLPAGWWAWKKQSKILYIRNAYIDFRSADRPENIEGFGYDYAFLNEAGIILKNEYLWHNAIKPMLWDYECPTVIGGAPKGKGVFYDLYLRGQDETQPRYKSFKVTPFDNPYLNGDEIREDMKSMPELVVRQEVYAEFLDDSGVVFRGVSDVSTEVEQEPINGHLYVMGVDLAKVQDFTVIAVYDRQTNKQVFQMRFNKIEWPYQKEKIKEVCKKYNNALVMLDATGVGDPIYDDLARDLVPIEPIKFTNEQKKQMIEKLSSWIELKNIRMIADATTTLEFNSFTYDISEKTGKWLYRAPVGFHDDIVMAHALAVWSLQPIIKKAEEPELSIIERDIHAKKESYDQDDIVTINIEAF